MFVIFLILLFFVYLSKKYENPYKLVMIYGKKGAGKTTYLTRMSIKFNREGWHVFSNTEIFGTYKLSTDWIGKLDFPEKSVLLLDEVGMIWDNRNFKSFAPEVRDFFKLQRHKKVYVIMASQSFDIDKKLRDLTDEMFLLQNLFNVFTVAKKINKYQTISNQDNDDGSKESISCLTENYKFAPFFNWIWTYNPRYFKFFNSFESEKLPAVPEHKYQFNDFAYLYTLTNNKKYVKQRLIDFKDHKLYQYRLSKLNLNCAASFYFNLNFRNLNI